MPVAAAGAVFKAPACSQGRLVSAIQKQKAPRPFGGRASFLWAQLVGGDCVPFRLFMGNQIAVDFTPN